MKKPHKIANFLSELGLGEKEAKIYLTLLKNGRATVSQIARDSGVTRTHVYDIAEGMAKAGLLNMIEEHKVRHFEALSHANLVAFIERKREQLARLEKNVMESVTEFEEIKQDTKPPANVQFFSGPDGVLQIYEQINSELKKLNKPFEIVTIFSPEKLESAFPGFFEQKKYIDVPPLMTKRDIVNESETFIKHLSQRAKSASKYYYKVWPKEMGNFPADTLCWENKIAFIEPSSYPTGTIIENEAIAKTFKMWFEKMWNNL